MSDSDNRSNLSDVDLKKEISALMKIDQTKHDKIHEKLREISKRYNNESVVDEIYSAYKTRLHKTLKLADKIANKLFAKYPHLSPNDYMDKVNKYQEKYKDNADTAFSNDEKKIIVDLILNRTKAGGYANDFTYTPMSRTLGYKPQNFAYTTGDISVSSSDAEYLNGLVKLCEGTKGLHQQIKLQTYLYNIADQFNQYTGVVDRNKVDVYNHVHPILFALFAPKIKLLDERMLLTSIADVVCKLKEKKPLETFPEIDMYDDICKDPINYDEKSPYKSLLERATIQTLLWKDVLNLRQGRYYDTNIVTFIDKLTCFNKSIGNDDFMYVKDVGTLFRSLFNCFSLRPIVVATNPSRSVFETGSNIMTNIATMRIMTIPMINVYIPYTEKELGVTTILKTFLVTRPRATQSEGSIVVKQQHVSCVNDILTFYVPRKFIEPKMYQCNKNYMFKCLPISTTGIEKLNNAPVDADVTVEISSGVDFKLKSFVAIETITSEYLENEEIIAGCTAVVYVEGKEGDDVPVYYSPIGIGACNDITRDAKTGVMPFAPLTFWPKDDDFDKFRQTHGSLYIYVDPTPQNRLSSRFA